MLYISKTLDVTMIRSLQVVFVGRKMCCIGLVRYVIMVTSRNLEFYNI